MKLYTTPAAPNPARVHFVMGEKNLSIETIEISVMKGEHKTDEYRKLVNNGRVPALVFDDGSTLCESVAICRYLDQLHPEPRLYGEEARQAAHIEMWDRIMEFELFMPMGMSFRHTHPAMAQLEQQVPEYGEIQKKAAHSRMKRLDRALGEHAFVAGDQFTGADVTAYCGLRFFKPFGFEIGEDLPNLRRWFDEVSERPGAKACTLR